MYWLFTWFNSAAMLNSNRPLLVNIFLISIGMRSSCLFQPWKALIFCTLPITLNPSQASNLFWASLWTYSAMQVFSFQTFSRATSSLAFCSSFSVTAQDSFIQSFISSKHQSSVFNLPIFFFSCFSLLDHYKPWHTF